MALTIRQRNLLFDAEKCAEHNPYHMDGLPEHRTGQTLERKGMVRIGGSSEVYLTDEGRKYIAKRREMYGSFCR
jgi:hypothetical protein